MMERMPNQGGRRNMENIPTAERKMINVLKNKAIAMSNLEAPDGKDTELEPLKEVVGDAKVVGLGEATHGSQEFSKAHHRITRFLVAEMDFDEVVLEVPEDTVSAVQKYIDTGEGNPEEAVQELGLNMWHTEEFADFVKWMRQHNEDHPTNKVKFSGWVPNTETFNRHQPEVMKGSDILVRQGAEKIADSIKEHGGKKVVWGFSGHIGSSEDNPNFGSHLKKQFGDDYMSIGSMFNKGNFIANDPNNDLARENALDTAEAGTYESLFAQTQNHFSITDIRNLSSNPDFSSWQGQQYALRSGIGNDFDPSWNLTYQKDDLSDRFDAVTYIDEVSLHKPLHEIKSLNKSDS